MFQDGACPKHEGGSVTRPWHRHTHVPCLAHKPAPLLPVNVCRVLPHTRYGSFRCVSGVCPATTPAVSHISLAKPLSLSCSHQHTCLKPRTAHTLQIVRTHATTCMRSVVHPSHQPSLTTTNRFGTATHTMMMSVKRRQPAKVCRPLHTHCELLL